MKVFVATKVAGCRPLTLLKLTFLQICFKSSANYSYLVFQGMVNKCAAPNCTSGYANNEKKQIGKFHFPLKNAQLKVH